MIKNIISTFFAKGLVAFINLGILLILSKQLGSEIVGQLSLLVLNIAIIQTINSIYTGPSLVYFIPKHSLRSIYKTGFVWTLVCTLVLNLLFVLLNIGISDFWMHVLFLSFISTLHAFHCVVLLAKEKIKTYNFLMFFQPALILLLLFVNVFLIGLRTVNAQIIALYVSFGASLFLSTWYLIGLVREDPNKEMIHDNASIFKTGFINQLGNLAHTLSNRYNFYLIGSAVLVGVYANASSLIESVLIIGGSVSPIILTHIANERDVVNNSRLTFLLSKICFMLSCCCVLIVFLLPTSFFIYFLGKDFTGVKTLMMYLSPGVLCISFVTVMSHYFSGLGQQKVQLWANCLGLLSTICLSRPLISLYGLSGACFTASFSYFLASLVVLAVFMKQNHFNFLSLFRFRRDLMLLKK